MVEWKKHDLLTLQEKEEMIKKHQELEHIPNCVAEIENTLRDQSAVNDRRITAIEDAICELDAIFNAVINKDTQGGK